MDTALKQFTLFSVATQNSWRHERSTIKFTLASDQIAP
jgi:hypothetical protein